MKSRLLILMTGVMFLIVWLPFTSRAFMASHTPHLPNLDKRQATNSIAQNQEAGLTHLKTLAPTAQASFDHITGSPRIVASTKSFLSDTNGVGHAISKSSIANFAKDRHAATKAFLQEHRELFGHGPEVLDSARVKREFVTAHNGLRTVVWEQQVNGIGVFEGQLVSHTTKQGELVNISSRFLAAPDKATLAGHRNPAALLQHPTISAQQAVDRAAQEVGEPASEQEIILTHTETNDPEQAQTFSSPNVKGSAHTHLVWLPINPKTLRLCWEVVFTSRTWGEMFQSVVDAQTGEVMVRRSLTVNLTDASYRVFTSDSPTPFSPGQSVPSTDQPPNVARTLVTWPALDTTASPNGWIDDGVNETRGNNVDAHLDRNADDKPDLPRPQGSPNRVFDFPLSLSVGPASYASASVVQLFYLCNWYHDKLYQLGFTEAAGNFQNDNFGKGGFGNDAVQADAQDGFDINNSDFSTPPDGQAPRMQMYIFTGPTPQRDGSLDAEVVLHEYTHGLSNRRVGGGAGLTEIQSMGMGEGWSDFYALSILSEAGDNVDGNYAMAAYVSYLLDGSKQNYYFGIRRYPYSTDLTKNPLTFKDIDPTQASAHPGIPLNPTIAFDPNAANEVHNQGEVWCSMLWEARAALIKKYGWATGNQLILQLVTDAMNLTPPNPNFIEARDAIILADRVDNAATNFKDLWAAFAKRGLGLNASSPSSSTTTGVIESYQSDDALFINHPNYLSSGKVGGPFSKISFSWSLGNLSSSNALHWVATPNVPWISLLQTEGSIVPPQADVTVTAYLNSSVLQLPAGTYTASVTFSNATSGVAQPRNFMLRVGQPDFFTEAFDSTPQELSGKSYTFTPDGSSSFYSACSSSINSFPTDPSGGINVSLADDEYIVAPISQGRVSLYGKPQTQFYIGSNGYITFGTGDEFNDQTFDWQFEYPRISGFLCDLDPSSAGSISWKETGDRVAVTWMGVPSYGMTDSNSFQIEMFTNGTLRLSYLHMEAPYGVIGLSQGYGIPANFAPSDFSSYLDCDVQTAVLSVLAPSLVTEGDGILVGKGTVTLSAALPFDLEVALTSSDESSLQLPPSLKISAGQTNATFDIDVIDNSLPDGTRNVLISAAAPGVSIIPAIVSVRDNENGIPGALDHFVWSAIASPEEAGAPFRATVSALDVFNNPATNIPPLSFTVLVPTSTNNLLANKPTAGTSIFGTYTLGYSFTPTNDITLTHARTYGATKLTLWTDTSTPSVVASVGIKPAMDTWVETPFTNPVFLKAGGHYRVAAYTGGYSYGWVSNTCPTTFPDGTIDQSWYSGMDEFPTNNASRLYIVDLKYTLGSLAPIAVSPATISSFTNGIWTGAITIAATATNLQLVADDGAGHRALSNPFDTAATGLRNLTARLLHDQIILSWPAPLGTYVLDETETLSPPNWVPVTNPPTLVSGQLYSTNQTPTKTHFYRLRQE